MNNFHFKNSLQQAYVQFSTVNLAPESAYFIRQMGREWTILFANRSRVSDEVREMPLASYRSRKEAEADLTDLRTVLEKSLSRGGGSSDEKIDNVFS